MMVRGLNRGDDRSGFGVSIDVCVCRSLVVVGFDHCDIRSGFGLSIDVGVLSIIGGGKIRS
jgi:hypothetical protein